MSEAAQPTHVLASIGLPIAVSLKWNGAVVCVAVCTNTVAHDLVSGHLGDQFAGTDFQDWKGRTLGPFLQRVILGDYTASLTLEWKDDTGHAVASVVKVSQER